MKTFYSIIYCSVRPQVEEKISIGLFMGDGHHCIFQYSTEKLQVIKSILSEKAYQLIKLQLHALNNLSQECEADQLKSFKGNRAVQESYFNYLNAYSNNLVTYSAPVSVDLPLESSNYKTLFEKFIFAYQKEESFVKSIPAIKKRLQQTLVNHVDIDITLDKSLVPNLVIPAKVFFIGQNEVTVAGEAHDLSSPRLATIQQQVNSYLYLVDHLQQLKGGKNGTYFFIADEPDKKLSENHKLWKDLCDANLLDIISSNEVERIETYMQEHDVVPFTEILN